MSTEYVFQACMPPSDVAVALAALRMVKNTPSIQEKIHENNRYMRKLLVENGWDFRTSKSPIVPVYFKDDQEVIEVGNMLRNEYGIYSTPIVYPATAKGCG